MGLEQRMTDSPTIAVRGSKRAEAMPEPERGSDGSLPTRRPGVEAGMSSACGPCATEEIWRPWRICVTAGEAGAFGFCRRYIRTSSIELHWDTFDGPCRLRGLSPPDGLVFLVPLRLGPRSRYWHRPMGKDQLPAMHSGGVDWVVDGGQSHLMLSVKYALLRRHFGEEFCAALDGSASIHCVPARPGEAQRLGAWLAGLIKDLDQRPEALLRRKAAANLEEKLLQGLEQTIDFARAASLKPAASARRRGLEMALAYLCEADLRAVTVALLVEVAGIGLRTLEHAFRDVFDMTPNRFLRLLRLHAARRVLTASEAHASTVASIADRTGFAQHGRFAIYYRELFGESPSETLRRPSGVSPARRSLPPEPRQLANSVNCRKPVWSVQTSTTPTEER